MDMGSWLSIGLCFAQHLLRRARRLLLLLLLSLRMPMTVTNPPPSDPILAALQSLDNNLVQESRRLDSASHLHLSPLQADIVGREVEDCPLFVDCKG